jgi:hypothetical protein
MPVGLWDVESPTFSRLSARRWRRDCQLYAPTALYTPGRFLVLISLRGWVELRAIMRLEGVGKLKKSTSSGTRTGDLPACSIVPQTTTLQSVYTYSNLNFSWSMINLKMSQKKTRPSGQSVHEIISNAEVQWPDYCDIWKCMYLEQYDKTSRFNGEYINRRNYNIWNTLNSLPLRYLASGREHEAWNLHTFGNMKTSVRLQT